MTPAMGALELIALALWSFAVSAAGGLVGLVLGNLRLPLVVLLASSPAAGAGANVAISGVAATTAATAHARAGRISWRLFAWMAPTSLAGAIAGGLISGALPSRVLLGVIAVVVLYGATEVARYRRPAQSRQRRDRRADPRLVAAAGDGQVGGRRPIRGRGHQRRGRSDRRGRWAPGTPAERCRLGPVRGRRRGGDPRRLRRLAPNWPS
ncbi:MAG: sulfite exporter TauE/SafE family protein [Actinobacteria bacterium]|nr:MAG: sulfite exporter TauE/SafE family protein [Actinomycetota bacterium]